MVVRIYPSFQRGCCDKAIIKLKSINIFQLVTVLLLLISDVLKLKYGNEKIKKVWQAIVGP
jgi:hypothetical protein